MMVSVVPAFVALLLQIAACHSIGIDPDDELGLGATTFASARRGLQQGDAPHQKLADPADWPLYSDPAGWPAKLRELLGEVTPPATCEDTLASNSGAESVCTYDCATLTQHYFPLAQPEKVRCFVADPQTAEWPAELLDLKSDYVTWDTYVNQQDASGPVAFEVGACTAVEPEDAADGDVPTECALEGAACTVSAGTGDCSYATRAECTPIMIKFATTAGSATFDLDGTAISVPPGNGTFVVRQCLHDAEYTITKTSTDTWVGTVTVTSYVDDNTIYIPNDEQWIIQGTYIDDDDAGGMLPLELGARVASGTYWNPTAASVVLRHLRISRQIATFKKSTSGIDVDGNRYSIPYSMPVGSFCQGTLCGANSGGAFEYWGGHQALIVFDGVVVDHCVAMRAGALMLDGVSPDPSGVGTTFTVINSIFWANMLQDGGVYSGGMIMYNMWPTHVSFIDSQWVDNDGFAGHVCIIAWVPSPRIASVGSELTGNSSISFVRTVISGSDRVYRNFGDNNGAALATGAMIVFQTPVKMLFPHRLDVTFDNCTIHDNLGNTQGQGYMFLNNPSGLAIPREEVPLVNTKWLNTDSTSNMGTANQLQAGAVWHGTGNSGETLIEKSRFDGNGCANDFDAPAGIVLLMGTLSDTVTTVVDTSFTNNVNGGAAAINFMGNGELRILRSSFKDNTARAVGGAVQVGAGAVDLVVAESIFARNTVISSGLVDIVVRVYTGGTGGTAPDDAACWIGECINSIWKMDGAVPDALTGSVPLEETVYGDADYEPSNLYAHVVTLEAGPHTLWTGAVLNSKDPETNWPGGAWIDITDSVLDPVQPTYYDNRAMPDESGVVRNLGCMTAAGNPADFENPCPVGQSFWGEPIEFVVGNGAGGAIYSTSTATLTIHDSVFEHNDAWDGHSFRVMKADSIYVENTTFEAAPLARSDVQAVSTQGVEPHTCAEKFTSRCKTSERCRFESNSVFCDSCAVNEYGDGKQCFACPSGTEPNYLKDGCDACSPGTFSELGICDHCGPGTAAPSSGQVVCDVCPAQTEPNFERTQCLCSTGSYNASEVVQICYSRGFDGAQLRDSLALHESTPSGIDCDSCPTDETGEECLSCEDGLGTVRPGFVAPLSLDQDSMTLSIFRCHNDLTIGVQRCPGSSVGIARRLEEGQRCNTGYTGIICGECSDGYGMSNKECVLCDDIGYTWQGVLVLVAILAGIFLLLFVAERKWRNFPLKHVIRCSAQPLRMLITYSQVTSQLGDILDFQFPGLFGDVLEFLRPLIDLWGLVFRALGPSECFGLGGFKSRWFLRVLGLPGIMSLVVFIIYLVYLWTRDHAEAISAAKSNMAFVVFFCYPTICIVTFASFICRPLTASQSFLELDDSIMCEDPSHVAIQIASLVVIGLVSVSLPLVVLVFLIKKAREYDRESRESYMPVAKRLAVDLGVDVTAAAFTVRDIVLGRDFSFIMDAYKPLYLWWEAIDMLRKLTLVGLVLVAGRGSTFQLSIAIVMSLLFFAVHILTLPYKVMADNAFRAATELHVFIAIAVALIHKTDLSMETVTADAYDAVLFISFILLVPVAFVASIFAKVRHMSQVVENALSTDEIPAIEVRRRAFELNMLGLGSDKEKEVLRRFIKGWSIKKRYATFLSHFKAEAAAEARILKLELLKALRTPDDKIFLDADSLSDLRELQACVAETDVLILMLTDGVLSRPWCLAELSTAAVSHVPIVILNINNSFQMSGGTQKVLKILNDLPAYLEQANPSATDDLKAIGLDVTKIGPLIAAAISESLSISVNTLTFDPNQSSVMLQSQIGALARAMVETACPENSVLLPDLVPKKPEPWVISRQIAIYVVYSEKLAAGLDSSVQQLAEEVKAWLQRRCDLESHHIVLCTEHNSGIREINEATTLDCEAVVKDTDIVLVLQSSEVLLEPRCLARLYSASINRVPIVPILLTGGGKDAGGSFTQWSFEQAKLTFSELGATLSSQAITSLERATGAATTTIGDELLQAIPNVISKPLTVGGVTTEFEAQMCDIELTLRREMATVGKAVVRTTPTTTENAENPARSKQRVRAVARVIGRSGTPPRRRQPLAENVPPEP